MRCNFCGAEWTLPYKMTITECPFCRRTLANPGASTRSSGYTPQSSGTTSSANRREDFDIVGTILREYKGTNPIVYVPEGITELGMVKPNTGAFYGNKVIQKIILPKSLRKMSTRAFSLSNIREVIFAEGITTIPERAFENCSNLRQVTLSSTVDAISDYAFYGCCNLRDVNLPSGLRSIGHSTFYGCNNLRQIDLPNNLEKVGCAAFEKAGLETITVPGSIREIPNGCFSHCTQLRTVDLQKGIKTIGQSAFANCTALVEAKLPDGTEKLCHGAFMDCYYLNRVVIPNSVAQIAEYKYYSRYSVDYGVFHNCTALIDVIWPAARFEPVIFKGSQYYEKIIAERKELAEQQKALEKKREHDRIMIMNGKCPKCNEDLTFWTNRCRKCGTKY